MKTNGANLINRAFKALRKNPCVENKCRLCMVMLAQAETDIERNVALGAVASIAADDASIAKIHYTLIESASLVGVDPATLGGGPTPEA